ncbi:MAG: RNase adapter RapZ [Dysosmobacter sp.]
MACPWRRTWCLTCGSCPIPSTSMSCATKRVWTHAVRDYVFRFQQTQEYLKRLEDLLAFSLPLYAEEGKTMLVIAVGCTGGHHRSVAVTHALTEYIRELGYSTSEHHRDLERGV